MSTPTNKITDTKNIRTAYLLWLPPLGWFGAHRFHLEQGWAGMRMCAIFSVSLIVLSITIPLFGEIVGLTSLVLIVVHPLTVLFGPTIILISFVLALGLILIWWISDGFLIRGAVKSHNASLLARSPNETLSSQKGGGAYTDKEKNEDTAFGWWCVLGWLGAHRLYAGRYDSGQIMLVLFGVALSRTCFVWVSTFTESGDSGITNPVAFGLF